MNILNTVVGIIGSVAAVVGAVGVFYAARQLRLQAWLKAQDIWCAPGFRKNRGKIFALLKKPGQSWTEEEKAVGCDVCRRIDELACLAPDLPRQKMLAAWGNPIAELWRGLSHLVREERESHKWPKKWDAFKNLGEDAERRLATK